MIGQPMWDEQKHEAGRVGERNKSTHMLAVARLGLLALGAMDKSGGFCVEAVEPVGLFVDKGVVLGHKLPANLRGHDILVDGRRGSGRRHCWEQPQAN